MGYVPSNQNGQTTMSNSAPVVFASDQSTLNTSLQEVATGGASVYHLVSTNTTNATNIKSSAGKVTGWYIYNNNGSARKVAFHNASTTPTAGATASFYFSIVIPPLSAANCPYPAGIAFSTGIGITTTTGLADSDATAVGSTDLIINIFYK